MRWYKIFFVYIFWDVGWYLQVVHRMSLAKAIRHGKERRNKRCRGGVVGVLGIVYMR